MYKNFETRIYKKKQKDFNEKAKNFDKKFVFDDLVKGRIELPENDEDFVMEQLHDDLMKIIHPKIEQKMNELGYYRHPVSKRAGEQKLPEGLLIEYKYEPRGGSIRLIDECKDYSYLLYTDYQNVLKSILERYCAEKKIIKLLMPIDIYLPND